MREIGQSATKTAAEVMADKEYSVIGHYAEVLDILPIPSKDLVASASFDGNMCTWSMTTM